MSDLSKLMKKIEEEKANKTQKVEDEFEEIDDDKEKEEEDLEEDDDEDDEEEKDDIVKKDSVPEIERKVNEKSETPQETKGLDKNVSVEQEVALLQNPAIYRREMLVIQKERNDLLTAIAEILLNGSKKK